MGHAVMKVNDSTAGPALIEQLKVEAVMPGEGVFAATQHDWPEEEVALIHQTRLKRLGSEISSAHREIVSCGRLPAPNCLGTERMLEGGPTA